MADFRTYLVCVVIQCPGFDSEYKPELIAAYDAADAETQTLVKLGRPVRSRAFIHSIYPWPNGREARKRIVDAVNASGFARLPDDFIINSF